MQKIQAKQVHRLLQSTISVDVAGVSGDNFITADLAAAVLGAGWRETDVPNQVHSAPAYPLTSQADLDAEIPGWRTSGDNFVEIWVAGTEDKLVSASGEEVYGRLVDGTGKVNLFTLEGSTETAYTLTGAVDVTANLPYVFTFETLPLNAFGGSVSKIGSDPKGNAYVVATLTLDNAATQTFAALAIPAEGEDATINVNGQVHEFINGAFSFDAGKTVITWDETVAGYQIDAADTVTIRYAV